LQLPELPSRWDYSQGKYNNTQRVTLVPYWLHRGRRAMKEDTERLDLRDNVRDSFARTERLRGETEPELI